MKSLKFPVDSLFAHRSRRGGAGAALVIALAFIVILSGLVAFFLTQSLLETQVSTASASQTEAALFARGSVDSVIGELKQEITAGSVAYYPPSGSDVRDPNCVFLPNYNQTMVPYRMDPGAPPNVLKRSASNITFYPTTYWNTSLKGPKWANNFSTTNPGTSGRAISIARWNAPWLMTTASTNTFIPPDWIYMTRTAGPFTAVWNASKLVPNTVSGSLNTNCVVGRFAYVVYDEGGLLDANVAGYDPNNVTPSMVRNKISEACADLTQIGLANSDITALIQWRNPVHAASGTVYTNYIYSPNTNAFLTPAAGERMFTSRQQLIDFLTQYVANGNVATLARVQGALPYLTHFSRELNAPSWYPESDVASSGAYGYYDNATNTATLATTTNIFVPLARATTAVYTDNSTGLALQSTNQAVGFSRFPLSRLAWLGTNGPVLGTNGLSSTPATAATQVQQSFGLVWDSSNNSTNCAWIYAGPTGSAVQSTIQSLGAITSREPNFFELLKAGILAGSVGVTPSAQGGTIPPPGAIDPRYGQSDQQIMQIGLATIDQASPALLPTRIEFAANTNGDWNGSLYGNKNLPYLYKMVFSPYRPTLAPAVTAVADGKSYTDEYFSAWEEPVFWNPYQTVTTNTAPLQIRIRADGTNNGVAGNIGADTDAQAVLNGGNLYVQCAPEVQCGPGGPATQNGGANGSSIELDSPNAATFCSLAATPIMLSSLLTNGFTPVFNDLRAQNPVVWPSQANMDIYTESGCTYAGFWLGMVPAPDQPDPDYAVKYQTTTYEPYAQSEFYSGPASHRSTQQFVLEANYGTAGTTNFLEVQRMRFDGTTSHSNDVEEDDNFTVVNRRLAFQTFNDPRTGRFSFDLMNPSSYYTLGKGNGTVLYPVSPTDINAITWTTFPSSANYFTGRINYVPISSTTATLTPSWVAGSNPATYIDSFRWADNTATSGTATTPVYQDTDGVQRPADGWWSSATANTLPMREDTPQDLPVILNRPFYSVGELGYVYRDMPWRSLNFCNTNSPDAGLLDFFCVNDGYAGMTNAPVVGGVLDLNTQNPQVLQAMLNGAARAQLYPANDVSATDATNMANAITNYTSVNSLVSSGPLLNKSEIATRLAPADPTVLTTATAEPGIDTNIKERREVIVRALASAGQVRTWNLMIDVIAQTGHLPPTATGFNNFIVTAEQRYWAHVAIDRYTGQVVSLQLEPVNE